MPNQPTLNADGFEIVDPNAPVSPAIPTQASAPQQTLNPDGFEVITPAEAQSAEASYQERQGAEETEKEHQLVEKYRKEGLTGLKPYIGESLESAYTGLIEQTPFLDTLESIFLSPEEIAAKKTIIAENKEQHPYAYYGAAGVGQITDALVLHEIAGGANAALGLEGVAAEGASTLAKAGRTVAKLGVEGSIFAAPEATKKLIIDKDPEGAMESLAIGAGANLLLHGVLAGGGELKEKLLGTMTREEASNATYKIAGLSPSVIDELSQRGISAKELYHAAGVTEADIVENGGKELRSKLIDLEKSGKEIGNYVKQLDAVPESKAIVEEAANQAREAVRKLIPAEVVEHEALEKKVEEATKALRDVEGGKSKEVIELEEKVRQGRIAVRDAASAEEKKVARSALNKMTDELGNLKTKTGADILANKTAARTALNLAKDELKALGPLPEDAIQLKGKLQPILTRLDAVAKRGTFADAQEAIQHAYGQKSLVDTGNVSKTLRAAYQDVKGAFRSAEEVAATKAGDPMIIEGIKKARVAYELHKIVGDSVDRAIAKEVPKPGLLQTLGKGVGLHGGTTGLAAGAVAHTLGLPVLPIAVGTLAGKALVKHIGEKMALTRVARAALETSPTPLSDAVLHALHIHDKQIAAGTRDLLKTMTGKEGKSALSAIVTSHAVSALLPDGTKLGKEEHLSALRNSVNEMRDPNVLAARIGPVSKQLKDEGYPKLAEAYNNHALRLMKVLQVILPADPSMSKAHPFSANVEIDEISPETKQKYERALTIAQKPEVLLDLVKHNTITQGDVAIAAAINPSTLQKMRNALIEEGLKKKPDLSLQQRLSLGILMGENLDESTVQLPVLQSVYGPTPPMGGTAGAPPAQGGKAKLGAKAQNHLTNSMLTVSEKSMGMGK